MTSEAIRGAEGEDIRGAVEGLRAQYLLPPGPAPPAGTKGRKIKGGCFLLWKVINGSNHGKGVGEYDKLVKRCFATPSCRGVRQPQAL